jgi:hypothetical protein
MSTVKNLNDVLRSRFLTIEFGPENEKLSLYTADMDPDGKANFKGALRDIVPMMAVTRRKEPRRWHDRDVQAMRHL